MNLPTDPADLDLEEAAVGEPDAPKHKRKPPKRKKKFGKYVRKGGDQKIASVAGSVATNQDVIQAPATNQDRSQAPTASNNTVHAALPTNSSHNNKRKATKSELLKAVGYGKREARKRWQKYDEHNNAMTLNRTRLSTKSQECRELATLCQVRR